MDDKFYKAARLIAQADSMIIATGAGMGVDSGLPDFRGDHGLWKAYPILQQNNLGFTDIANPQSFINHPKLAWGFYGHRLNMYREVTPHSGFGIILKWARQLKNGYFGFTSNVDGHLQKAGFSSENIYECHGTIHYLQCVNACTDNYWPAENFHPQINEYCEIINTMPICPQCGGLARPNILMFNDWNWIDKKSNGQINLFRQWLAGLDKKPLILEIGAGKAVPTVRNFANRMARHGSKLIRINLRDADINNQQNIEIAMSAEKVLTKIDDCFNLLT